jgi:hypothetical protein
MKRATAVLALMLAMETASASGWTPPTTIVSAYVEDNDLVIVQTDNQTTFTAGCTGGAWVFKLPSTDARRARVWATILTAIASGKQISFWYSDTCAILNYHEFVSVKIIS